MAGDGKQQAFGSVVTLQRDRPCKSMSSCLQLADVSQIAGIFIVAFARPSFQTQPEVSERILAILTDKPKTSIADMATPRIYRKRPSRRSSSRPSCCARTGRSSRSFNFGWVKRGSALVGVVTISGALVKCCRCWVNSRVGGRKPVSPRPSGTSLNFVRLVITYMITSPLGCPIIT